MLGSESMTRRHAAALGLTMVVIWTGFFVRPSLAQPAPAGVPITTGAGTKFRIRAVPDGLGGVYVAYVVQDAARVFVQHASADGRLAPGWPPDGFRINTLTAYDERYEVLVSDGSGGAICGYWDNGALFAQRVVSTGIAPQGWPSTGVPLDIPWNGTIWAFDVAADGQGGAVFAWGSNLAIGNPTGIYAMGITAAGVRGSGWIASGNSISVPPGYKFLPWVMTSKPDGAIAAWLDSRDPSNRRIYAQKLSALGVSAWMNNGVPISPEGTEQDNPAMVEDGSGGAVITFIDSRTGPSLRSVFAQHLMASGVVDPSWPVGGLPICLSTASGATIAATSDNHGGVFAFWEDKRNGDLDLYGTHVLSDGTIAPGWAPSGNPVAVVPGDQTSPCCVLDAMGNAMVAWQDARSGTKQVYVQRISADGVIAPGWAPNGVPIAPTSGIQQLPLLISDEPRGTLLTWVDDRTAPVGALYVQRLMDEPPVDAQPSIVRVSAWPGRVDLTWLMGRSGVSACAVDRKEANSDWKEMARPAADGSGQVTFSDTHAIAGLRYAYRLRYSVFGGASATDVVWVDVPNPPKLALDGPRPDPATEYIDLAFSLAPNSPAQLDLIDVSGRMLRSMTIQPNDGSRQSVRIDGADMPPPGVYWVRLSQDGRQVVRRGAVLR